MMTKAQLKSEFWKWAEAGCGANEHDDNDQAELNVWVELFACSVADDEIEGIDSDRELGPRNEDLTVLEDDVMLAIAGHKRY